MTERATQKTYVQRDRKITPKYNASGPTYLKGGIKTKHWYNYRIRPTPSWIHTRVVSSTMLAKSKCFEMRPTVNSARLSLTTLSAFAGDEPFLLCNLLATTNLNRSSATTKSYQPSNKQVIRITTENIHSLTAYFCAYYTTTDYLHFLQSIASAFRSCQAWQSFFTTSVRVIFYGLCCWTLCAVLGLTPSTAYSTHFNPIIVILS